MPFRPSLPPVSASHLLITCVMITPTPSVKMANTSSRVRNATSPSSRPNTAHSATPSGHASQKLHPAFKVRMPTV